MEPSLRRIEFFKRLNTLIQWEGMEKEIRKNISKSPRYKRPTSLQWNIVI
ncbi:MAG: hypothetical protein ACMUEL_07980 [Flavobacteriales bacterium Tduv]